MRCRPEAGSPPLPWRSRPDVGATAVEKILARASGKAAVKAGDVVEPRVDLAMSHENAALVINQFREIYEGTGLAAKVFSTVASGA